jgi:hypothetical protein
MLLLVVRSRTTFKVGVIGAGLLAAFLLGDILTYSQVGFSSAASFADYLFGITYYGGDIRYLFDILLTVYIATFLFGLSAIALSRHQNPSRSAKDSGAPTEPAG